MVSGAAAAIIPKSGPARIGGLASIDWPTPAVFSQAISPGVVFQKWVVSLSRVMGA